MSTEALRKSSPANKAAPHRMAALRTRRPTLPLKSLNRRGEKNPVAPNDCARMSQPRNLHLPGNIPIPREILAIGNTNRLLAPELWPILRKGGNYKRSR